MSRPARPGRSPRVAALHYREVEVCAVARVAQAQAATGRGVCVVTGYARFGR